MKNKSWRTAIFASLIICLLSGLAIVLTEANIVFVVIFFASWLVLVIASKVCQRRI